MKSWLMLAGGLSGLQDTGFLHSPEEPHVTPSWGSRERGVHSLGEFQHPRPSRGDCRGEEAVSGRERADQGKHSFPLTPLPSSLILSSSCR